MSDKDTSAAQKFMEKALPELKEAGVRVGGKQAVKLAQEPIAALLLRGLPDDEKSDLLRAKVGKAVRTKAGGALVGFAIGGSILAVPGEHPILDAVGKELRQEGIATFGDELLDVIMGPLRAFIAATIANGGVPPTTLHALPVEAVGKVKMSPLVEAAAPVVEAAPAPVAIGSTRRSSGGKR